MHEKKSENALSSETFAKRLIENMSEAVWVGDADEKTVYANPRFCELMEYPLEEMLGRESYQFWDEESAKTVRNVNVTKRKKGISSSYEGNLLSRSGKKIPVLLNGTPLPGGGTIGIMTDLTELKKRESMYKNLVEHMNEGVWMGDKDGITLYANPKFCRMVGSSLTEVIGVPSEKFWDEDSRMKIEEVNRTKRSKGISSSYEGTLVNRFGQKIPLLISGTPLPDGGTFAIMTDLSELKERERKERILSSAIKYANDAIIMFNPNGEISLWNKGAKIIFGYKEQEILGKPLDILFRDKDVVSALKESEVLYNVELAAVHRNKHPITISATLTPLLQEEFYLLIARDITTHVKFEEELTLKYEKMKEAYNKFGILRRQMDYIFEVLKFFSENHELKSMADYFVSSIIMLTRVDACILRIYNKQKGTLDLLSCFGVEQDWKGKASIKYKNSLTEKAFHQKMPLKIIDIAKEPRYQSKFLTRKNNLCSLLLIPLQFKSELVGSLSLYTRPDKKSEIFENDFIEKYVKLIEIAVGSMFQSTK